MNKISITPLGIISPYPKNNENCPGFLVEYKNNKILLDCGNGITRLLKFPNDLNNLTVIITHYHKDHFVDIGAILYASYVYHKLGLLNNKINIMLPKKDYNFNKKFITSSDTNHCKFIYIENELSFNIDDLKITFEDNKSHSIESFMVNIENNNTKIVYTSDIGTTNFENLINFCKNSDLIICESSFLKTDKALSNIHMTAYDAASLAKKSKSKRLLLTHFWPERDKTLYLKEAKQIFKNTKIAKQGSKIVLK